MRTCYFFLLCLLVFSGTAQAQLNNGCDGTRYRTPVFTTVDTTDFVQFGSNVTFAGNPQDLFMTIYEPQGDTLSARPVVVMAFGGSFVTGDRYQVADLCENLAQRGFVVAAIDYRVYDGPLFPFPDSLDMMEVVMGAISDFKASVRFLREDAATQNRFRIDSNYIFGGGVSAGGITAVHTAYMQETDTIPSYLMAIINAQGGLEGNSSSNFQYSSEIQGAISYSGALHRVNWIDSSDVPLYAVHEEGDNVVPYGFGSATISGFPIVTVFGGESMSQRLDALGISNTFLSYPDNAHVGYFSDPAKQLAVLNGTAEFLEEQVCTGSIVSTTELEPLATELRLYPNPAQQAVQVELNEPLSFHARLVDATGRLVWEQVFNETQYLEVPQQAAGYYFLRLDFGSANRAPVVRPVVYQR